MMAERDLSLAAHHHHALGAPLCARVRAPLEPVRTVGRVIVARRRELGEDPRQVGVSGQFNVGRLRLNKS
jgi:hypothetical protein